MAGVVSRRDPVADRDHLPHARGEGLVGVGVDPGLIGIVGPRDLEQVLADFPIDPKARQQRRDADLVGRVVGQRQEVVGVVGAGRRVLGRRRLGRRDAKALEEALVQRSLDHDRLACAGGELNQRVIVRRTRRSDRERPGKVSQIVRVLEHVEDEALARERARGQLLIERQRQDRAVERSDPRPGVRGEGHGTFRSRQRAWKWCTGPWPWPTRS